MGMKGRDFGRISEASKSREKYVYHLFFSSPPSVCKASSNLADVLASERSFLGSARGRATTERKKCVNKKQMKLKDGPR